MKHNNYKNDHYVFLKLVITIIEKNVNQKYKKYCCNTCVYMISRMIPIVYNCMFTFLHVQLVATHSELPFFIER